MTGVLVEGGVEIDYLQPFGTLVNPLARAGNWIDIEDDRIFGITLGETHYLSISQVNGRKNSKVI
jgi:hypothetical protein